MRVAVEFVTTRSQQQFLVWLAEALKDAPAMCVESVSFPDASEPNVGAYSQGTDGLEGYESASDFRIGYPER